MVIFWMVWTSWPDESFSRNSPDKRPHLKLCDADWWRNTGLLLLFPAESGLNSKGFVFSHLGWQWACCQPGTFHLWWTLLLWWSANKGGWNGFCNCASLLCLNPVPASWFTHLHGQQLPSHVVLILTSGMKQRHFNTDPQRCVCTYYTDSEARKRRTKGAHKRYCNRGLCHS